MHERHRPRPGAGQRAGSLLRSGLSREGLAQGAAWHAMLGEEIEIPLIIGGREVRTGKTGRDRLPHDHAPRPGHLPSGRPARRSSRRSRPPAEAWREWSEMPWEARAAVFLKAADLLAGPWRDTVNAATMLGQSKTVYQAEIDSACELIDFWRFNAHYRAADLRRAAGLGSRGVWNTVDYRPLEGFVFAVTPFNFTSIGGNLPTAPALMGNTVLWKPASTSILSELLHHADARGGGAAARRDQLRARPRRARSATRSSPAATSPGSTSPVRPATFQGMWKTIADQHRRSTAPTRGSSARPAARTSSSPTRPPTCDALVVALVRGAFEYQGQKCSAASRAYVPQSLWPAVKERAASRRSTRSGWARRSTSATSWRRSSTKPRSTTRWATSTSPKSNDGADPRRRQRRQGDRVLRRADRRADRRIRTSS